MSENKKINHSTSQIHIADDVIATICGTAALEVDGVQDLGSGQAGFSEFISGKKSLTKGIKIQFEEEELLISCDLIIRHGSKIHSVAKEVQERVKNAVETMTGIHVREVNIHITGIGLEKPKEKEKTE